MNAENTLKKMGFSSTDEEGVYELSDVVAIGLEIRVKVYVDRNGVDYAVSLVDVSVEDGSETTFARGRAFPKTDEALVNMISSGIIKQTEALMETVCSRVKAIGYWCGEKGNK